MTTRGLPESLRAAASERALVTGQALFCIGEIPPGLFEVVKGRVRLVRTDTAGRETVLHTAEPGDIVSEASLFASSYHCNAIAAAPSVVRLYPKAALLEAFAHDAQAARDFMAMLAHEIMSLRTRLELANIHSARERVRQYLALHAATDSNTVTLPGTVKEWATDLGLSHETLYRTLAHMQQDGAIRRVGRKIIVLSAI